MEIHGNEMNNFYFDWDVNAVKGLLQTGRFAHYTDTILDEIIKIGMYFGGLIKLCSCIGLSLCTTLWPRNT